MNDRRLLAAILRVCGVPDALFSAICSEIDKLDKQSWEQVRAQMIAKSLSSAVVDKLSRFVSKTKRSTQDPDLALPKRTRQRIQRVRLPNFCQDNNGHSIDKS